MCVLVRIQSWALFHDNILSDNDFKTEESHYRQKNKGLRQEMKQEKQQYPHRKAKLIIPEKITGKWYIEYYLWDELNAVLVRKRWYKGFAKLDSYAKKLDWGKKKVRDINDWLPTYARNRLSTKAPPTIRPKLISIKDAIELVYVSFYANTGRKTQVNFESNKRMFFQWLEDNLYTFEDVKRFSQGHAQMYVDHLRTINSPTTVRNKAGILSTMFTHLLKRNVIDVNPFKELILPKKQITKKNFAYTADLIQIIKKHIGKLDPYMWCLCQITYYTYIRPGELRLLKIRDIDLENHRIMISSEISKNNKTEYVTIPEPLLAVLEQMSIKNAMPHHYLLTKEKHPGDKPVGYNWIARMYRNAIQDLKLPPEYTFYGWKHTGVTIAYKSGVDLKAIQLQCRHYSIEQTDTYLKSLGFIENESFRTGIPEI